MYSRHLARPLHAAFASPAASIHRIHRIHRIHTSFRKHLNLSNSSTLSPPTGKSLASRRALFSHSAGQLLAPQKTESVKMADIKAVATEDAFSPAGPYSQAVITPTLIFVSGQVPRPPANSSVPPIPPAHAPASTSKPPIAVDTALCIANLRAILEAAGSSLDKVVKTTVFLTDMERDFATMNAEYAQHFTGGSGGTRPARSCVEVKRLPLGVQVEIECVALP